MKIIKVLVYVSTNRVGSKVEEEIEVEIDDDLTESEIDAQVEEAGREWMFNNIEWNATKITN